MHVPEDAVWYVRPVRRAETRATLDRLAHLVRQERIPGLDLSDHWELTDHSLSHLKSLPTLVFLDISRTKISDAGLAALQSCRKLCILLLPDTVTDHGLLALSVPLAAMRDLNLDESHITDRGVETLTHFSYLENLDLSSTHVTDAGLVFLKKLPRLRRLVLPPSITDASAASLRELKTLREIDISQTQIGAPGLAALASLPKLRTIYLSPQSVGRGSQSIVRQFIDESH